MRRLCAVLASAALIIGFGFTTDVGTAQAAPPAAPRATSQPVLGTSFTMSGRLPTKVARPIQVQQKIGKKWTTIARGNTTRKGAYSVAVTVDSASAQLRVLAPSYRPGKRTYSKIVTKTTTLRPVRVTPNTPMAGETFTVTDSLRRPGPRPVSLQRKNGSRWVTVAKTKTSRSGAYTFSTSVATTADLRVSAPRATVKKRRQAAVTTKSFRVRIQDQTATLALPKSASVGQAFDATATFTPARPGRGVQLQRFAGGLWQTVATGTEGASGTAHLKYTPLEAGTFGYRIVALPSNGAAAATSPASTLTAATDTSAVSITVTTPTVAPTNEQFNAVLLAAGGTAPYHWEVTGLPDGIVLTADGRLTGKPVTLGTYVAQLSAVDATGRTASTTLEIVVVAAVEITTTTLESGVRGVAYETALSATGGSQVFTWSATNVPAGMAVTDDGILAGTPTETGEHELTLTVTDTNSTSTSKDFTLTVTDPLEVTTTSLPDGQKGAAYTVALTATGGTAPYTWSATNLPDGLALSSSGTLSGTPTASGNFDLPVTVTDSLGASDSSTLGLKLTAISFTGLAAGEDHSCALNTEGGVVCWGRNNYGQLGNETLNDSKTPVAVFGLSSGVQAVANGNGFSCAVTTAGEAKCWGYNMSGQLGNNDPSNTSSKIPVTVSGLTSGVTAITAGNNHACALISDGTVRCWGKGDKGQLGNSSTANRKVPVSVTDIYAGVTSLTAGGEHTCAAKYSGAWCWGSNNAGQVGITTTATLLSSPRAVTDLASGIAMVSARGNHSCAVTSAGAVTCWGSNTYGELGDGTTTSSYTPVAVSGLSSGVTSVTTGSSHSCALSSTGGVSCWGRNNLGQLGNAGTANSSTPVGVDTLSSGVTTMASGTDHTCAVTGSGIACWGNDNYGQLGDGGGFLQPEALQVVGISDAAAITGADYSNCALSASGGVSCWGRNNYGQLGNGSTTDSSTPVDVSGLSSGVTAITGGGTHVCALTDAGAVKCWGRNNYGQLGNDGTTDSSTPVDVSGLSSGVTAISSLASHTCAITSGGSLVCWGYNNAGQLGNGNTTNATAPVTVTGLTGVTAVSTGGNHTCALAAGAVSCWGANQTGQIGDGTTTTRSAPTSVLASGVTAIEAGSGQTCAIVSGGLQCWGYNGSGQLGDGTTTNRLVPTDVPGLSDVASVTYAGSNACAVTTDGSAFCWGNNAYGQVGDKTTTTRLSPTAVTVVGSVASVQAGRNFTCALRSGGDVWCWGYNDYGQLGHPTNSRTSPVLVKFSSD